MKQYCDNCNKPVLKSDPVCWHCGHTLPEQATSATQESGGGSVEEASADALPIAKLALHGGLTMFVILLALLFMRSLGQKPLLALNPATRTQDWQSIVDDSQRYAIDIPVVWEVALTDVDGEKIAEWLADNPDLATAVDPLGGGVDDTEWLLVARSGDNYLVLAHSQRLSRLTAETAVEWHSTRTSDDFEIMQSIVGTSLSGLPQADLIVRNNENNAQCQQRFIPQGNDSYLLSVCTHVSRFGRFSETFEEILSSFQPLKRTSFQP